MTVPTEIITKASGILIDQLGTEGIDKIGGRTWWQWRYRRSDLEAEWIEMRSDCAERKRKGEKGRRVMLYIHGGAYFFGSVDEHRYQLQRHARKLRARVLAPRYRLAPQFPFPCGLHDCLAAYLYLLTMQEPEEIVLAGDSAGGGMVVSILVILRDQGLPLPAGAVLISPWVDLTHSFPSVAGGSELDYIPSHGFMQKPSSSWPPPSDIDMEQIAQGQPASDELPRDPLAKELGNSEAEAAAVKGYTVRSRTEEEVKRTKDFTSLSDRDAQSGSIVTSGGPNLSVEIDGNLVVLEDQIQLYATNQLISHPLVSPVLQPSLGGLPPLLILTGGGEILRDEQIYLAHKAANPKRYRLEGPYHAQYDPGDEILNKHGATDVQLQVWDDLCHVAPTLSFTRPAKFMYRSVAQFGAWALARAQRRSIEITEDDDLSIISSGPETDSTSSTNLGKPNARSLATGASVGKAGDPLPAFKYHMIRQRVDRHGVIYPMEPECELTALQMPASDVGVIKSGPVRKWLAVKKEWDMRYAPEKRKVQKRRIKEMFEDGFGSFGDGERPPRSALAGWRKKADMDSDFGKRKKSWGMMLWSVWGSKHDESTIRREVEMVNKEEGIKTEATGSNTVEGDVDISDTRGKIGKSRGVSIALRSRLRRKSRTKSVTGGTGASSPGSRSRRRTVTVMDRGQTEGDTTS